MKRLSTSVDLGRRERPSELTSPRCKEYSENCWGGGTRLAMLEYAIGGEVACAPIPSVLCPEGIKGLRRIQCGEPARGDGIHEEARG